MAQDWNKLSDEEIKRRLNEALHGRTMQWLSEETGESYRNVQRWLGRGKETSTTPAHFVARFVAVVPINPGWVLREELPKERRPPEETERRLDRALKALRGED